MKNKEKADKAINTVAAIAIIAFFVGAIVAIWIGLVGVKILLSAVVLFIADWTIAFRINVKKHHIHTRTRDRKKPGTTQISK